MNLAALGREPNILLEASSLAETPVVWRNVKDLVSYKAIDFTGAKTVLWWYPSVYYNMECARVLYASSFFATAPISAAAW